MVRRRKIIECMHGPARGCNTGIPGVRVTSHNARGACPCIHSLSRGRSPKFNGRVCLCVTTPFDEIATIRASIVQHIAYKLLKWVQRSTGSTIRCGSISRGSMLRPSPNQPAHLSRGSLSRGSMLRPFRNQRAHPCPHRRPPTVSGTGNPAGKSCRRACVPVFHDEQRL